MFPHGPRRRRGAMRDQNARAAIRQPRSSTQVSLPKEARWHGQEGLLGEGTTVRFDEMAGEASIRDALTRTRNRVGHYRILAPLGAGGMGVVYLVEDEVLGRRVALKLLAPGLADSPDFRDRFVRESRLAASIEHPGIVPIYEAGEADGTLFIAMRLVDGPDLRTLLAADGPLAPARAADLVAQVAAALDAAHAVGLVHRDVKPANVMIDRAGGREHCYLTDFGLTKNISATSGYTSTGQVVGTLSYVAPEQIQGGPVSARADVYSLGCVLFECLTGSVPFRRDHDVALMYAHMQDPPPQAHDLRPELPAGIDQVLARALAKAPEDRQPSCGQLAVEARPAPAGPRGAASERPRARPPRFARPSPVAPPPPAAAAPPPPRTPVVMPLPVQLQPPPPPRGGRHLRAAAIVAAAILLCAGGIAAALVLHHNASSKTSDAQRILDETIALNRELRSQAIRLSNEGRSNDRLRARLRADENRVRELQDEAESKLDDAAAVQAAVIRATKLLDRAAQKLKTAAANPGAVDLSGLIATLGALDNRLNKTKAQLPQSTAGGGGKPGGPLTKGTRAIRLPSRAAVRITGGSIIDATPVDNVGGDDHDDLL